MILIAATASCDACGRNLPLYGLLSSIHSSFFSFSLVVCYALWSRLFSHPEQDWRFRCHFCPSQTQTFATAPANVCNRSRKRLREKPSFSICPRKYVQPSPQVRATVPASTCIRPCKYVQPSPQVRAVKRSVLASTCNRPRKYVHPSP